ncbi:uncharacterized protein LOC129330638 [Eublepharis macularius]|uniref:Uncharacterized protein LOC129330638 n=1 Tax=Eublepharis macularius TaxID=481883 RepID=A0AA97JGT8_EUBMA|nr:uncharacterized protein LOC129330638 [Eublepharis macularius]
MMEKSKFRADWLLKKDRNGHLMSVRASRHSETEVFCKLCLCTVDFQNKGLHALLQHSYYAKHKKLASDLLGPKQMVLVAANPGDSSETIQSEYPGSSHSSSAPVIKLYSLKNAATVSELIWVMKSVCCNFSASSCSGIKETFDAMFPGGVPTDFSLSPKKMRYLITDALGPYFQQMISDDVGTSFYSICFDETTSVEDKKELQISVRYWSEGRGEVVSSHLQTFFIGKADAQTLHEKIHTAISRANLPIHKLLMIGSDGPNVNKKVHRLFNENLIEMRSHGLVHIGTCLLHIVHNSYLKALQTFG